MNDEYKSHEGPMPKLKVDLSDAHSVGGRSDFVPHGNYEMETVSVEIAKSKDGTKPLLRYTDIVVGPSNKGATIITNHPAPIGSDEKNNEYAKSFLFQRLGAMASYAGKDPDVVRKALELDESNFKGKKFYATLKPGEGDFSDLSGIDGYRSKAQYEARPGTFET